MFTLIALNRQHVRALALPLWLVLVTSLPLDGDEPKSQGALYFPTKGGEWATTPPVAGGWDAKRLDRAIDYAIKNRSTGIVILQGGRILAERYYDLADIPADEKRRLVLRTDEMGNSIEDVASCQKSVVSVLIGMAIQKELLTLEDPVAELLGRGWSNATAEQESKIHIRHLLTMTSGLTEGGDYQAEPGTRWKYNTAIYAKLMEVLEHVTKQDRNVLTKVWLTDPLGMSDSVWVERSGRAARSANRYGFATSARDLARFGLLLLASGDWDGKTLVRNKGYLSDSITTSQEMNPFYGYLWWLNRNAADPEGPKRIHSAPRDMFSANGAGNRRCWVVPSLGLVVTRLGAPPPDGKAFDQKFWQLLMHAKQ